VIRTVRSGQVLRARDDRRPDALALVAGDAPHLGNCDRHESLIVAAILAASAAIDEAESVSRYDREDSREQSIKGTLRRLLTRE
jgi:hypothetical protein